MATTPEVAVYVNYATPHKLVPAPSTGSREQRNAANNSQPLGSPRKWKDVWGPTIVVLTVNLFALVATAAFAVGSFSERINGVQGDVSKLEKTTESVRQDLGSLKVSFGRVDERLNNLQQSADRQATAVETLNDTVKSMATNDE